LGICVLIEVNFVVGIFLIWMLGFSEEELQAAATM
jgi:hypothetical protein